MSTPADLARLEALYDQGFLTAIEFEAAKTAGAQSPTSTALEQRLARLELEQQLDREDQHWQEARKPFLYKGHEPNEGIGVVLGVVAVIVGLLSMARSPGFGIGAILMGVAAAAWGCFNDVEYTWLHQEHQRRRSEIEQLPDPQADGRKC